MSRRSRTRVSSSPSTADPGPTRRRSAGNGKRVAGISPGRLWRGLGAKVSSVFSFVSVSCAARHDSSPADSSKSDLMRSRSVADPINESHRAEAIGDCIKFLNSSSSVQRSKPGLGGS